MALDSYEKLMWKKTPIIGSIETSFQLLFLDWEKERDTIVYEYNNNNN